jgi:serine/threonine protein kinase
VFITEQLTTTDRYIIRRRLGAGGMGVVYEAFDKQREQVVALKTLRWADAAAVYRFKREFRSLTNVRHPNLVSLYELAAKGDEWFFTMERVDGVDFLQYVHPSIRRHEDAHGQSATSRQASLDPIALQRLRAALKQLAQGLYALHRAGKVHQDIKPTNVLVTPDDRVVILDFGLTADSGLADPLEVTADAMWGTAGYMAPEYGNGPPGPAADWYAVGTMVYEALTGQPPYHGGPATMLRAKWRTEREPPRSPADLAPGLPSDLVDLCMAMLSHDPRERPNGRQVLERLDTPRQSHGALQGPELTKHTVFVGRNLELKELNAGHDAGRSGRSAAVLVKGPSGIGKSTLVSHFLQGQVERGDTVVLAGRCYARETVPDKALDGIVESLCAHLRKLPISNARQLTPENLTSLVHLFSILRQVPAFATEVADATAPSGDWMEIRRRGYEALSELFRRLSVIQPVIVHVDDLQWADEESLRGLCDVLGPAHPPPMTFIASFRNGWDGEDLVSDRLEQAVDYFRKLELGPLDPASVHQLVTGLSPEGNHSREFATEICGESEGNPFLIEQIVRHVGASGRSSMRVNVEDIVRDRLQRLGEDQRSLMEAVAVAGHPVAARTVHRAVDLQGDERDAAAALEIARFVRVGKREHLEPFHDKIRQAVVATLPVERIRLLHRRLAIELGKEDDPSPELLFEHHLAAGDMERAGEYAEIAAQVAARSLRFERGIQLYTWALTLEKPDPESSRRLNAALASALSGAGRLSEAADAYLNAAGVTEGPERIEYQRLGAEHLLLSGRIEEGLREVSAVLDASGLSMATSPQRALLSLIWSRLRVRLQMARHAWSPTTTASLADLRRVDVCRSVAEGLAHLDYIHAADFQARHTRLALRSADPDRIARALAIEAGFSVLHGGNGGLRRGRRLLQEAETLAAQTESNHALSLCTLISGTTAYFRGDWVRARDATARAQSQFQKLGTGVAWELMTAQLYHTLSLFYAGDLQTLVSQAGRFLNEAEQRGNRFASTIVQTGPANVIWLVRDDTTGARAALQDALDSWPAKPFRTPHYLAVTADARIGLYEGDGSRALDVVTRNWANLKSTRLLRIQVIRVIMWHLRATCLLAASNGDGDLARKALRDAQKIRRENRRWCRALALVIEAQASTLSGARDRSPGLFREAIVALEGADMRLHAESARRQLGLLVGGDEGKGLIRAADRWMATQGVWNPRRMAGMIFPENREYRGTTGSNQLEPERI